MFTFTTGKRLFKQLFSNLLIENGNSQLLVSSDLLHKLESLSTKLLLVLKQIWSCSQRATESSNFNFLFCIRKREFRYLKFILK